MPDTVPESRWFHLCMADDLASPNAFVTTRLETAREQAFRSTATYLIQSAGTVIAEDRPVCEAVQQGRPGIADLPHITGIYGRRERRILDFHQAMLRQLGETA